jgi:hypothetical protein
LLLIPSTGWSSGKRNPVRLRPDADGNGLLAVLPSTNRRW